MNIQTLISIPNIAQLIPSPLILDTPQETSWFSRGFTLIWDHRMGVFNNMRGVELLLLLLLLYYI